MKLKDKKQFPLFSLEFLSEIDGIVLLRKKHKKVVQDIYVARKYLIALLGKLKGESK